MVLIIGEPEMKVHYNALVIMNLLLCKSCMESEV
ncbi:MAG: hypothetical protein H6Q17_1187 [Bacteroidetes bacterium]|nr:hypothetical protein [Bacteroidota bacterium]